jgi:membrane protein implicated in regulation of membrane protease activity
MRSLSLLLGIVLLIPGGFAIVAMIAAMWRGAVSSERMLTWIGCMAVSVVGLILIADRIAARWERRD